MRVRLVVDDRAPTGLLAEHGFSAWIDDGARRVLFDTGQGPALARNAAALGIPLASLDAVVLSHGHHDHSGGTPYAVEQSPTVELCCHPAARAPRYAVDAGVARPLSMPAPARAALDRLDRLGRVRWIARPTALGPGTGLVAAMPRPPGSEDADRRLSLDPDGRTPDPVVDELALWVRTAAGLVVLVGCGHAGVVGTLRQVQACSGEPRIHAVLGGFHLRHAPAGRLRRTVEELRALAPELVVPCHCTGEEALRALASALGARVQPGAAGAAFEFPRAASRA